MVPAGIAIGVLVGAKKEDGSKKKEKKEKKEKSSTAKDFKLIAGSRDGKLCFQYKFVWLLIWLLTEVKLTICSALRSTQDTLETIASMLERAANTFNWTIPFASRVLASLLIIISVVLYLVPIRLLLSLWGINKICRKLVQPGFVDNNEVVDFLSRMPSNPQHAQLSNRPYEPKSE